MAQAYSPHSTISGSIDLVRRRSNLTCTDEGSSGKLRKGSTKMLRLIQNIDAMKNTRPAGRFVGVRPNDGFSWDAQDIQAKHATRDHSIHRRC